MAVRRYVRRRVKKRRPQIRRTPLSSAIGARMDAKQGMTGDSGILIGGVFDPAEKAADRMADRVMGVPGYQGTVHRKCEACEEEGRKARRAPEAPDEEEKVQAKGVPGTTPAVASPGAAKAIRSLGGGRPLGGVDKVFFEPRFGADLSSVRIHDGPAADRAARGINARAFTLGRDIAFAEGERQPETHKGRRLLAHELAHVVQAGNAPSRQVRRKPELQTADHPKDKDFLKVPAKDKPRLNGALALIDKVAKDKQCRAYFKDKCSGGGEDELANAVNDAKIFKIAGSGLQFGSSFTRTDPADARNIGYTDYVHRISQWQLAATLLHEMFHTCIIGAIPEEEEVAEKGIQACRFYTPWIHRVTPESAKAGGEVRVLAHRVGSGPDADHRLNLGGLNITVFEKWAFQGSGLDVRFKVPAGAKSGDLVFENHKIKSNKRKFTVLP